MTNKTVIIAEAGVNHNGSIEMAIQLIDLAAEAGADYIKFQTFRAHEIAGKNAPMAEYQKLALGDEDNQLNMLKKLELSQNQHFELAKHCEKKRIKFLSTPFDAESLVFLTENLAVELIKIPSGEINNPFLLLAAGRARKPVILSTGMATLADIEVALGVLAFGMLGSKDFPSEENFKKAFCSKEGQREIQNNVTLLHCTTEYPAHFGDINLRAMDTLARAFGLPVGLSDHSPGIVIPAVAVALGARVIEKHFTIDKQLPGPDHQASLEPDELKNMIRDIRNIEQALGNGKKLPFKAEISNLAVARRSIVAIDNIEIGQAFTLKNIGLKRPGKGMSPMKVWDILGKLATKSYCPGDNIQI